MKENDFLKKLLLTFVDEAQDHLQIISSGLLKLESMTKPDMDLVETIYREIHSLKGASRTVNYKEIEKTCQTLESIISKWKENELEISSEQFDIFHQAIATIHHQLFKPEDQVHDETQSRLDPSFSDTVRISIYKLDELLIKAEETLSVKLILDHRIQELNDISFLIAHWEKNRDHDQIKIVHKKISDLEKHLSLDRYNLGTIVDQLLLDTKKLLMLPFSTLLNSFPIMVRNLSREQNKEVSLTIIGDQIEIDKRILEELKDPFLHLIRNCIDHGIELPDQRKETHKPPQGHIRVTINQVGSNEVEIDVEDDGQGIDLLKLKNSAVQKGYLTSEQADQLDEKGLLNLVFHSGVSTSAKLTEVSGRGLGMPIVLEKITKLGGHIAIDSKPNIGTQIKLILPLTLSTFRGVVIKVADQPYVMPIIHLERTLRLPIDQIKTIENKRVISLQGVSLSLVRLSDLFRIQSMAHQDYLSVIIIKQGDMRVAIEVDEILNEQEFLVKKLGSPLKRVRFISAATTLPSGKAIPILNPTALIKAAIQSSDISFEIKPKLEQEQILKPILIVEDSITTRMLLKNILEMAGYKVTAVVDGVEAWHALHDQDFSLIVSDVEMPKMDGFELTRKIRADKKFKELPVILVTGRESAQDKERGIEVGASAYLVKSSFDQSNLLETIQRLVNLSPV